MKRIYLDLSDHDYLTLCERSSGNVKELLEHRIHEMILDTEGDFEAAADANHDSAA